MSKLVWPMWKLSNIKLLYSTQSSGTWVLFVISIKLNCIIVSLILKEYVH